MQIKLLKVSITIRKASFNNAEYNFVQMFHGNQTLFNTTEHRSTSSRIIKHHSKGFSNAFNLPKSTMEMLNLFDRDRRRCCSHMTVNRCLLLYHQVLLTSFKSTNNHLLAVFYGHEKCARAKLNG